MAMLSAGFHVHKPAEDSYNNAIYSGSSTFRKPKSLIMSPIKGSKKARPHDNTTSISKSRFAMLDKRNTSLNTTEYFYRKEARDRFKYDIASTRDIAYFCSEPGKFQILS